MSTQPQTPETGLVILQPAELGLPEEQVQLEALYAEAKPTTVQIVQPNSTDLPEGVRVGHIFNKKLGENFKDATGRTQLHFIPLYIHLKREKFCTANGRWQAGAAKLCESYDGIQPVKGNDYNKLVPQAQYCVDPRNPRVKLCDHAKFAEGYKSGDATGKPTCGESVVIEMLELTMELPMTLIMPVGGKGENRDASEKIHNWITTKNMAANKKAAIAKRTNPDADTREYGYWDWTVKVTTEKGADGRNYILKIEEVEPIRDAEVAKHYYELLSKYANVRKYMKEMAKLAREQRAAENENGGGELEAEMGEPSGAPIEGEYVEQPGAGL